MPEVWERTTQKQQQLQQKLDDCRNNQAQLAQMQQRKRSELDARFLQLSNDIVKFRKLESEKKLLQPFFACFPQELSRVNGHLAIHGKVVAPATFDAQNCFAVYQELKKSFLSRYNQLMTNSALWERFRHSIQGMRELASQYNTFLSMEQEIPKLRTQAQTAICQEFDHQRLALADQEKTLLKQLQTVQLQCTSIAEALETIRREINFSNIIEQEQNFHNELVLPLGYNAENGIKLCWNLNDCNGLRIVVPAERIDEGRDPAVCKIVTNTVLHFLRSYPAGATRLAVFDACKMPELDKLCADLITANPGIRDENDRASTEEAFLYKSNRMSGVGNERKYGSKIANAFDEITDMLDSSKTRDVFAFNVTHEDAFQPIVLFVIYGCPGSYKLDKEKANLIGNARQHGVYLLIVEEETDKQDRFDAYREDKTKSISQLRDMMTLRLTSTNLGDLQAEYADEQYWLATPSPQFDMQKFVADFQNRVLQQYKKPLLLEKVFAAYEGRTRDFSQSLDIPVGREENGEIKLFSFHSNTSLAHMALIGKTGSGKSSILQAIVLGGAYYYSPDEIEFYLIDMKKGDAFYKQGVVDYSKLKHVRMLAAGCSAKDMNDFIAHIYETKLQEAKGTDIISYNKTHTGREKMKRTVIVIDEYTEVTDTKSVDTLAQIARQGRSFGISLILSSLTKGNNQILRNNVGILAEFKNDSAGAMIDDYSAARSRSADRMFLIGRVGNCISATSESNKISHFRAAFMEGKRQAEFIEQINAKYADCPTEKTIIVGSTQRELHPYACAANRTTVTDSGDAVLAATIGRGIFGGATSIQFGNGQIKKLLLIGDVCRSKNLEYSMLVAARQARKYYLCFNSKPDPAFRDVALVMDSEEQIEQAMQEVYGLYQNCKQGGTQTPVLMILHDCGYGDSILLRKNQDQEERILPEKPALSPLQKPAEQIPGIDEERFAELLEQFGDTTRYESERPRQKQYTQSLASMLQELLDDGIRYGICLVLSCDHDGIRKEQEVLGGRVSKTFRDIIAVPSLQVDASYARDNLLRALEVTNKADALKNSKFNRSELLRCYHVTDKDVKQFIPYEWE